MVNIAHKKLLSVFLEKPYSYNIRLPFCVRIYSLLLSKLVTRGHLW